MLAKLLTESFWLTAIAMFFGSMLLEFFWTRTVAAVSGNNAKLAALNSGMYMFLGAVTTVGYVSDPYMIIPMVLGAGCGTYIAMVLKKK